MKHSNPCIFCGEKRGLSKEHFWPLWLASFLPSQQENGNISEFYSSEFKQPARLQRRSERQGAVNTKKVRVVCAPCNNEWMSDLENKTKPIILGLLSRSCTKLDNDAAAHVALWVAVKSIVSEHMNKSTALTTVRDRELLYKDREIPNYFRIFIGYHSSSTHAALQRHSTTVSRTFAGPSPSLGPGINRNIQTTTFLVGSLCIYVPAARVNDFDISILDPPHNMAMLWPRPSTEIDLSAFPTLDLLNITRVSKTLDRLIANPRVVYGGPNPP
jgi:hypothetical protein